MTEKTADDLHNDYANVDQFIEAELRDYEQDDGAGYCFQPNSDEKFHRWEFAQHLLGDSVIRPFLRLVVAREIALEKLRIQDGGCRKCGAPPECGHWGQCDGKTFLEDIGALPEGEPGRG